MSSFLHRIRRRVAHDASGEAIPRQSGYRGLNYSDPFGLFADSTKSESSPTQGRDSASTADPCDAYASSPAIGGICRRVNGPGAKSDNECTAKCLANQWTDTERSKGRPLNFSETLKYIFVDHPTCYHRCGYGKIEFAIDFLLGTGAYRRPKEPNIYLCVKAGGDYCQRPPQ